MSREIKKGALVSFHANNIRRGTTSFFNLGNAQVSRRKSASEPDKAESLMTRLFTLFKFKREENHEVEREY